MPKHKTVLLPPKITIGGHPPTPAEMKHISQALIAVLRRFSPLERQ